jgi:hypothetical protein
MIKENNLMIVLYIYEVFLLDEKYKDKEMLNVLYMDNFYFIASAISQIIYIYLNG